MSLLGGAALTPLIVSRGHTDPRDGCGLPVAQDDGWPVASVNDDSRIERDALCRMAARLAASSSVHAVVVARHGKLMFERYFRGDEQIPGRLYGHRIENITFDADTLHNMKSASKSVM